MIEIRWHWMLWIAAAGALSAGAGERSGAGSNPLDTPVGGVNAAEPAPPPELVIDTTEVKVGDAFSIRVPTGEYTAPEGGAPNYSVPGPIVAFKGPDGVWRGHGYLETYPRLLSFKGSVDEDTVTLDYRFEDEQSYNAVIELAEDHVVLRETSDLGPRNLYVFDAFYGWQPSAGFAVNRTAAHHAFVYLPCHYDKPEVTIRPARLTADAEAADAEPSGVAVVSGDPDTKDVAGFWCAELADWRNADAMGLQLWQRRQRPGEPGSRHFLGPETKSDSTPNPATAKMIGQSLYEGHVTIELSLGRGTRVLGFAATGKGETKPQTPEAFKRIVKEAE